MQIFKGVKCKSSIILCELFSRRGHFSSEVMDLQ